MKFLKEFGVIVLITLAAEILEYLLPLPVPASIYGLLLMLTLLLTGVLKVEKVEGAADFLVEIMPVMFIPAAAGLLKSYSALDGVLIPVAVIIAVTTVIIMVVTGLVSQKLIQKKRKHEGKSDSEGNQSEK